MVYQHHAVSLSRPKGLRQNKSKSFNGVEDFYDDSIQLIRK
jgi:hypothetical protein